MTKMDEMCDNGVVHLITKVMVPASGTIYDRVNDDPNLTTLNRALSASDLANNLHGKI